MDFVNSGYAILEWGLPGWGPIPGGPAGMHEVIPQSQFFRDQMVTAPSGPTARPKTTNPEEPELPPTQPPGDLPDPDLPPPTPPTTGPENPGTGTPGGVIPRIPPIPSLPPNDIPEIPFVPERPAEPGNGLEADPPVAPGTIANQESKIKNQIPPGHGRDQDAMQQDARTLPPVAPVEMTGMAAEGGIPFARMANRDTGNVNGRLPNTATIDMRTRTRLRTATPGKLSAPHVRHGRDRDVLEQDLRTSPPVAPTIANRKSEIKNGNTPSTLPLFGWTWLDVALLAILPLLLLVALLTRRRRRMT